MQDHTFAETQEKESLSQKNSFKGKRDRRIQNMRVNIGNLPRWKELMKEKDFERDTEVACFLLDSYERGPVSSTPMKTGFKAPLAPAASTIFSSDTDRYETTATSTPSVHGFTRPPAAVSVILSDRKGQEMKSDGFGPWSSVSLKLQQVQEDGDGNDSSSFSVDLRQVKQEVPVQVKQEVPVQVKQEVPVQVKQEVPVQVKQEVPVQVKQEVPVQEKQEVPVQVKQEDPDESEFWCMQQDPVMSGVIDASHPVQLTFNKLKEETDRYCGNVELLPSEHPVQTLKSEDLKTEEAHEEHSMDRKDHIKVCSNSISNQTTHMQTNQVSSTTQLVSTVSELAMKGQCENCLILAKVREELQMQIAVLQNRIRAIICAKVSQHSVCSPHSDLDYEKLLKGFHKNCLGKNPLCKASENTTQKVSHVRDFILHVTKGYPPIKTLLFLDNMERINEWVVTLQNGNMNVRHYLLDVLAFLKFLNRTSRPIAHLTRHSRNRISRQLRQKLKNINALIISHKRALKDSGNNPSTPNRPVNRSTS